MDFHVNCQCGNRITVSEGAAGATIACRCGRAVSIPSLKELRLRAGIAPHNPSPELVIEHQLAAGELPPDNNCIECGVTTAEVVQIVVECERAFRKGGFSWGALLLSAFLLPIKLFHWEEEVEYGKDKVYPLPLAVCEHCRHVLGSARGIKQCLQRIPAYARLLEKFPNAKVRLMDR